MLLSLATAAVQVIDAGVSVQKVDYAKLRERLIADHQVPEWTKEMQEASQKNKKK